ncbi:MAG TPA: methionyl-tRNA formyltransferase, partial [Acidimicrobiaceae bacterium]|nr:methionyl-tRNA formyltransferase [Acidimicrobiaceae bacterium]
MKSELPEPPEHPKSIVFLGTPEAAVPSLRKLVEAGFEIPLV